MASSRTIMASMGWVLPQLAYQPVTINGDDPALSAANMVKQTMLGPPFAWPWNRSEVSLDLVPAIASPKTAAKQDYVLATSTLGYVERAILNDGKAAAGSITQIEQRLSLAPESRTQRPASFAIQTDDGAGNLGVRINTLPDLAYSLTLTHQRKPAAITSMANTWSPIPDELAYVYDWGFLALLSVLTKDARMPIFRGTFASHILALQDGLTAMQKNLFLGNWLQLTTALQRAQGDVQQGLQGRTQ